MPSIFTDATGHGYDLLITSPADWAVSSGGMPNGDNYVAGDGSIAPTYNLSGDDFPIWNGTGWTIEFWVYEVTGVPNQILMSCETTGSVVWVVYWDATVRPNLLGVNTSGATHCQLIGNPMTTGTWHHVCIWITSSLLTLKIDGTTDNTTSSFTGTGRTPTASHRLWLGTDSASANDMGNQHRFAKLAIYNRVITTTEITDHIAAMS